MVKKSIADLREDYRHGTLTEDQVPEDPYVLFDRWFQDAQEAALPEPNAMTLATVNDTGKPSARIVLLKGYSSDGFVFYTNYESRKGQDIAANPYVSIVFFWQAIERQVRIEGRIEKLSDEKSTEYYCSRPKGSQIGAWASPQSAVIKDRWDIEQAYETIAQKYEGEEVLPKPPHWGGYLIKASMIEFWQGRSSRMHDRIRYQRAENKWSIDRLAP